MDDDVDVIVGGTVEVVRFDDFQGFVHQRRGVAGDFGAHVPVRVRGRFRV